jgi:hypothetical protein
MYYEVFKNLRLELVNEGKLNLRTMEADFLKFLKSTDPNLFPTTCELDENSKSVIRDLDGTIRIVRSYDVIPPDHLLPGCSITFENEQGEAIEPPLEYGP